MKDTIKKYSEDRYYTKQELAQEIDHYLLEPVWQEICSYRAMFRCDIHIGHISYSLIRNPLVLNKMMQLHELLFQVSYDKRIKPGQAESLLYVSEEKRYIWNYFMTQMQMNSSISFESYLQQMKELLQLHDVSRELIQFLCNEEQPLLVCYFILLTVLSKESAVLIQYPLFLTHQCLPVLYLLPFDEIYESVQREKNDFDITSSFIAFLDRIRLKLFHIMISLENEEQGDIQALQEHELMEKYPALQREQILFFVNHREYKHYYTIKHYMEFNAVCYETARYSLDQLVREHWYHKQKLGKKYVYYVM